MIVFDFNRSLKMRMVRENGCLSPVLCTDFRKESPIFF